MRLHQFPLLYHMRDASVQPPFAMKTVSPLDILAERAAENPEALAELALILDRKGQEAYASALALPRARSRTGGRKRPRPGRGWCWRGMCPVGISGS